MNKGRGATKVNPFTVAAAPAVHGRVPAVSLNRCLTTSNMLPAQNKTSKVTFYLFYLRFRLIKAVRLHCPECTGADYTIRPAPVTFRLTEPQLTLNCHNVDINIREVPA